MKNWSPRSSRGLPPHSRALTEQLAKLRQSLRKVEAEVRDVVAPAAAAAAAEVLYAAVFRECPVGTGFMRSRIEVVEGESSAGTFTLYVQIGEADFVGKTYYAAMVEYGTDDMPANPFMRRALDMDGDKAREAARKVVADAFSKGFHS